MYQQIAANKRKTVFMMAIFVGLVVCLGWIFGHFMGQPAITPYVLVGALIYALISYFAGSSVALAVNGAQEIQKQDNPRLWRIVENLSITDGLPMPRVFIMQDPAPNAFATGRDPNHAAVCATTGILDIMTDTELEGVFAHELGHVKNYDIRVSIMIFALVAVVSLLADVMLRISWFGGGDNDDNNGNQVFFFLGIAAAILAPIIATLIQLAISRRREYLADATGALTTRYPEGLASALEKIKQTGSATKRQNTSTAHLFFASPLRGHSVLNLFSTHPPIDDRIKRLREMEGHA
ncbi:MAG TPA: M48 family metalloprotease [Patescibacteria group bacterium]|nr:M48 family metalloprotease [Patescibacteria group bacterium]